jgi:hypothetical protein
MMPRIRLDTFMIEAMGGESGPHYKSYLEDCIKAFLCLRQHMSLFYQMLLALPEVRPLSLPCLQSILHPHHIMFHFSFVISIQ